MSGKGKGRFGKFRFCLSYIGYRTAIAILARLPLWFTRPLGKWLAYAFFARGGRRVDYMLINMRIAFPDWGEDVLRRVGRETFVSLAWNLIDLARSSRWDLDQIEEHIAFEGFENLKTAMARGKGAMLLTLHMGNFEIGALGASLADVDFTAVGRPMTNPYTREYVFKQRERMGANMVVQRNVAPQILRALKKGHAVPVLNDQYVRPERGVMARLFGVRCSTSHGIAALALRSGAAIVPVYALRKGEEDLHRIIFLPEIPVRELEDKAATIQRITEDCNAVLEELIREHPEQWLWSHRRFRYSPDLPENLYGT
ncbi:MAG: lysophospholipid acyltransferase family protein [Deltaproteobacteria bacterium]|nr:lysophospholipid acyltransferase family protein [Deltaproteobacteria bacterium]